MKSWAHLVKKQREEKMAKNCKCKILEMAILPHHKTPLSREESESERLITTCKARADSELIVNFGRCIGRVQSKEEKGTVHELMSNDDLRGNGRADNLLLQHEAIWW